VKIDFYFQVRRPAVISRIYFFLEEKKELFIEVLKRHGCKPSICLSQIEGFFIFKAENMMSEDLNV